MTTHFFSNTQALRRIIDRSLSPPTVCMTPALNFVHVYVVANSTFHTHYPVVRVVLGKCIPMRPFSCMILTSKINKKSARWTPLYRQSKFDSVMKKVRFPVSFHLRVCISVRFGFTDKKPSSKASLSSTLQKYCFSVQLLG